MASSGLRKMLPLININTLGVLVLVCAEILCRHRCSGRCDSHFFSVDVPDVSDQNICDCRCHAIASATTLVSVQNHKTH